MLTVPSTSDAPLHRGPDVSVVVPTFNDRENVLELTHRIEQSLQGISWEIIYVDDDSPDRTAELLRDLAAQDPRIRCIQRIGRRGLSSACIEGMLSSSAPYLAVIDADLQHDERLLPQMLAELARGEVDIVVGSRYTLGASIGESDAGRAPLSRVAGRLSRSLVPYGLTDPMSDFFMLRRTAFDHALRKLSAIGSQILTDLFASSPQPLRFKELAYEFRSRRPADSKLDSLTLWGSAMLRMDKTFGHIVPVRFVAFALVGAMGVAVHFAMLTLLFRFADLRFAESQAAATVFTMSVNFVLNNQLTYRDQRLHGLQWVRGWLSFNLACGVGGIMNVGLATYLYQISGTWYFAAIAGIVVGAVWNYAVTKSLTWNNRAA